MFTLVFKGESCEAHSVYAELTWITDSYHGFHCKASTDHKKEVGRRSGEEDKEIHGGKL